MLRCVAPSEISPDISPDLRGISPEMNFQFKLKDFDKEQALEDFGPKLPREWAQNLGASIIFSYYLSYRFNSSLMSIILSIF